MDILMTILSIILFFIALGVLVTIHELGHFVAAKSCNVYCDTFSIGFGPKIAKFKRKKGETRFTIGIIPLGGYVSMYGEDAQEDSKEKDKSDETFNIPRKRSLQGVSRWKRLIIFAAGIIMNFILAYIIFFISAVSFPQLTSTPNINVATITNEVAFKENFKNAAGSELSDDELSFISNKSVFNVYYLRFDYTYIDLSNRETTISIDIPYIVDTYNMTINDGETNYGFIIGSMNLKDPDYSNFISSIFEVQRINTSNPLPKGYSNLTIRDNAGNFTPIQENIEINLPLVGSDGSLKTAELENGDYLSGNLDFFDQNKEDFVSTSFTFKTNEENTLSEIGLGMYTKFEYVGLKAFQIAGEQWIDSTTAISKALGQLFYSGEAWNNVGGPVAIFAQSTQILNTYPFYYYLNSWGIISVNLALFNLLPFPGLDGWQILVELIEGGVNLVYKAKNKVKNDKKNKTSKELEINQPIEATIIDDKASVNKDTNLVVGENDASSQKEHLPYDDEWHIPSKVKNVVSYIGLALLFVFMFAIIFKDIFTYF